MPKKFTVKMLARLMWEELDRDSWGDVDPYLFLMIVKGLSEDEDDYEKDARALERVLKRVVDRIRKL